MSAIDPRALVPRKPRSQWTAEEREAERDQDRKRRSGATVEIGLGCEWKRPIRSDDHD